MKLSKTAYICLWFPKPSETFVFQEVMSLFHLGLPLSVYSLYGKIRNNLASEMRSYPGEVNRLGLLSLPLLTLSFFYWLFRFPRRTIRFLAFILLRKWRGLEKTGENLWAVFCAFHLAFRFEKEAVEHIHAPWACGCATAAWVASRLTGIPFSFTMRAWDIYPPDSLLREKTDAAFLIRSESRYNIRYLKKLTGCGEQKLHLTYNGVPMVSMPKRSVRLLPPFRLLAVGRLVGKKGYAFLLRACRELHEQSVDFHLDIVGDGNKGRHLKSLARRLAIQSRVTFHGFQPHDRIRPFYRKADILIMPCIVDSSGDRDGIPTVLFESLLNDVPVIATPVSGIPELIEDGRTGLLVPPGNPGAIAAAVMRLVENKEEARGMAARGRKRVMELSDPAINHRHLLALYAKSLNDHRAN